MEGLKRYQIVPATGADIAYIADLEAQVYGQEDAVPEPVLAEWFRANPTGFSILRDARGAAAGHLDILPLRPHSFAAFCKGDLIEREIRGDALHPPAERGSIATLYVESIVITLPRPSMRGPAMLCLLEDFAAIVRRVADAERVESIYAIAATGAGERFMWKLGFSLATNCGRRRDGHHLFVAPLAEVLVRVGQLSGAATARGRSLPSPFHP